MGIVHIIIRFTCALAFNKINILLRNLLLRRKKIVVNKPCNGRRNIQSPSKVAKTCRNSEVAADDVILIRSQQVAQCQRFRGFTRQNCIMQPTHVIVSNQRRCCFTRLIN
jgi:hypothetical protein